MRDEAVDAAAVANHTVTRDGVRNEAEAIGHRTIAGELRRRRHLRQRACAHDLAAEERALPPHHIADRRAQRAGREGIVHAEVLGVHERPAIVAVALCAVLYERTGRAVSRRLHA